MKCFSFLLNAKEVLLSAVTYSPASYLAFSSASPCTAISSAPSIAVDSDDSPGI